MRIHVNLDDLAVLLDLPDGMTIVGSSSDELSAVFDVEADDEYPDEAVAHYELLDGLVQLVGFAPLV